MQNITSTEAVLEYRQEPAVAPVRIWHRLFHNIGLYFRIMSGKKSRLVTEIQSGHKYSIVFPCDKTATEAANEMALRAFGKANYIPSSVIELWRKKNPKLLSVLVDSNSGCRGYFDLLPLKEQFYKSFMRGEKVEEDITADVIMGPDQEPTHLYIGGVTSTDGNPIIGSLLLTSMLLKIRFLYLYTNKKPITIGALAATEDGEYYLKEFGFQEALVSKGMRKDGMTFYEREMSKSDVDEYLDEWGRRSKFLDYSAYRWYMVR
ncbi:MAG: hypothetical protein IM631_12665 [Cytophagales bacterium]|nr:hypothetical protein [Cytophagales bacterium]MCA6382368.1 hypothetical protein [Cytophagales bacterium]